MHYLDLSIYIQLCIIYKRQGQTNAFSFFLSGVFGHNPCSSLQFFCQSGMCLTPFPKVSLELRLKTYPATYLASFLEFYFVLLCPSLWSEEARKEH